MTGCEEFYGFTTRPFTLTPDLRFVYQSRSHSHAFKEVTEALQRREGLIVITGEIGTGKTVLCRALLETFHEARTFLSVILDPLLGVDDLLHQVLIDFGLITRDARTTHAPLPEATRHQLVTTLQKFLASLIPLNAHAVIMVDEAQHLTTPVLEQIRLLSNFETERAKLLQIVLVGQPNLETMLRQPDLRQLDQRVARRIQLQPLSGDEVREYITRRLAVASAPAMPFTPAALGAIQRISQGIPRVVNTVCDRALEIGFERGAKPVDRDIIEAAAERLKLSTRAPAPVGPVAVLRTVERASPRTAIAAAVVLLALTAGGLWLWRGASRQEPAPPTQPPTQAKAPAPTTALAPAAPPPTVASPQPAGATPAVSSPATAQTAPPGGARQPPPTAAPPPSVQPPAPAGSKAEPAATAPAGAGNYRIAVAAFRTSRRANDVAAEIAAKGLPVSARLDPTGEWYQVIVGPFATIEAATNAQKVLEREGFPGTRISVPNPER